MIEKMNPIDRRMKIIKILYERGHETTKNLANELGVGLRTIRYDINHLSLSFPIETVRGRHGGGVKICNLCVNKKYLNTAQIDFLKKIKIHLPSEDALIIDSILNGFSLVR